MELGFDGKVCVVTAASRGIGYAIAAELLREGAHVVICSRDRERVAQAAANLEEETGRPIALALEADVSRPEAIQRLVTAVENRFAQVHALVLNAGGPPSGPFASFPDEAWEQAFQTNLMSAVRLVRAFLPLLRHAGGARIVAIASSSVKEPIPGLVLSNVMRAGVQALMKTLAVELGPESILVNTLCPGRIATDRLRELDEARAARESRSREDVQREMEALIPLRRYGTPAEFARVAAFLLSEANTYVTGQTLLIDGGLVKAL
ncbi:MAG TPA: SDR family oxidoreductase [Calditerricola sp.]